MRRIALLAVLVACGGRTSAPPADPAPVPAAPRPPAVATPAPLPVTDPSPAPQIAIGQYRGGDTETEQRIAALLPGVACASYGSRGYTLACDGNKADYARHVLAQAVEREGLRFFVYNPDGTAPAPLTAPREGK